MKLLGKHTQDVADRIVASFQKPEDLPKALAPVFIHRRDDVPCRKWSWHNQLVAAMSGTTDARGFRQWAEVGRKVKKGCHAIWILAPCIKTIKDKDDAGEEIKRQIVYGFRSVPVFRLADTEGEPLPGTDDKYDDWVKELPLLEVAQVWGLNVGTYSGGGHSPLGYFQYGRSGQAVMLGVENLSTWAHEIIHAADYRLPKQKNQKWRDEIIAELGGAVLLECLGMKYDADLGGAYDYIRHYAKSADMDVVRACIQVLGRVCDCVSLILDTAESLEGTLDSGRLSIAS